MMKVNYYKVVLAELEGNGIALIPCNDKAFNTQEAALTAAEEMANKDGKNYLVMKLEAKSTSKTGWFIAGAVSAVAVIAAGVAFGIKLVKTKKN